MPRDDYYRGLCDYPHEYDKTIDMIAALNPAAAKNMYNESAEEFACMVVHDSIRAVLYGDCGAWSTTGGCLAVKAGNPKKVILAYNGPFEKAG